MGLLETGAGKARISHNARHGRKVPDSMGKLWGGRGRRYRGEMYQMGEEKPPRGYAVVGKGFIFAVGIGKWVFPQKKTRYQKIWRIW